MKKVAGQIDLFAYIKERDGKSIHHCGQCVCNNCLYWWSKRCPYGDCYDDIRAKENPYDKTHPDEPPRKDWSNWDKPGEQAHWCRGGMFYPISYCEHFVKYEGSTVEDCVDAPMQIFQDGYVICSLKDTVGCDECIARSEGRAREQIYGCPYMTEVGCEAHINALALMAHNILNEGENMEMCGEQCCIGCTKTCGYRCGQAHYRTRWEERNE